MAQKIVILVGEGEKDTKFSGGRAQKLVSLVREGVKFTKFSGDGRKIY